MSGCATLWHLLLSKPKSASVIVVSTANRWPGIRSVTMKLRLRPTFWMINLVVAPFTSAVAQKENARLVGTVVDHTSGAVIANADIVQLGVGRRVSTDSLGRFQLPDLAPGIVR